MTMIMMEKVNFSWFFIVLQLHDVVWMLCRVCEINENIFMNSKLKLRVEFTVDEEWKISWIRAQKLISKVIQCN